MTLRFSAVRAVEILDSRGHPTLSVTLTLADGRHVGADVPSGVSIGSREAAELRDGDPARYGGHGVLRAAAHVTTEIADGIVGREFASAVEVDAALIIMDGTAAKRRYGTQAITGVSLAAARAEAAVRGVPLWRSLATAAHTRPRLPVPHVTVVEGGAHAGNGSDFQDFMLVPLGAPTFAEAVRAAAEIRSRLGARLAFAGLSTATGDEGGFAPAFDRPEDILTLVVAAIADAGYPTGRNGVVLSLDPAATGFRDGDGYLSAGHRLTADRLIDRYEEMADRFPVWSIEDGLAEDDQDGWARLTSRLGERLQLVGDDIFCTDPLAIARSAAQGIANCALIAANQAGTVTEALEAVRVCRAAGFAAVVSHRSGQTTDTFTADLAVAAGSGQIKAGATAGGERTATFNRLLAVAGAHPGLPYGLP